MPVLAEPPVIGTLKVVNPAPLSVTNNVPDGIAPAAVRAVMLTFCTPFTGVPVGEIVRVPRFAVEDRQH